LLLAKPYRKPQLAQMIRIALDAAPATAEAEASATTRRRQAL
jgi:hypothetical protein